MNLDHWLILMFKENQLTFPDVDPFPSNYVRVFSMGNVDLECHLAGLSVQVSHQDFTGFVHPIQGSTNFYLRVWEIVNLMNTYIQCIVKSFFYLNKH